MRTNFGNWIFQQSFVPAKHKTKKEITLPCVFFCFILFYFINLNLWETQLIPSFCGVIEKAPRRSEGKKAISIIDIATKDGFKHLLLAFNAKCFYWSILSLEVLNEILR